MKLEVYEFRPLVLGRYLRYNSGKWTESDGSEFDLAFVGLSDTCMAWYFDIEHRENILWKWVLNGKWNAFVENHPRGNAWHYMLKSGTKDWGEQVRDNKHPNYIAGREAMDKCCSIYSCANGRGPEFEIGDEYISRGLLRNAETKRVVKFPKTFHCMYCGKHDWKKETSK